MVIRPKPSILVAVLLVALPLAGCGNEGSDAGADRGPATTAADRPATTRASTTTSRPAADGAEGCDRPFQGVMRRSAGGGHEAREVRDDAVTDTIAYRLGPGTVTVYASDRPIDTAAFREYDQGRFSTENALRAPAGGSLLAVFLLSRGDDDLETGTTITYGPGWPSPILDTGGGAASTTNNPSGTLEVLALDDDGICVRIDYRDDAQEIAAVIDAPFWAGRGTAGDGDLERDGDTER